MACVDIQSVIPGNSGLRARGARVGFRAAGGPGSKRACAHPYNPGCPNPCRSPRVRSTLVWNLLTVLTGLVLSFELSGCAAPRAPVAPCPPAARAAGEVAPAAAWWVRAGDPVLARLIDTSLAGNARLNRQAAALAAAQARSARWSWRLREWLGSLLGYPAQDLRAVALRLAQARRRKAEAVALAYLKLRRQQRLLTLGQQFQDQFRDNADIARWRREAGLASAVDGGLAAAMLGVHASSLDTQRERVSMAVADLARSCGMPAEALGDLLNDGVGVPRLAPPPADSLARDRAATALRLAALGRVAAREAALRAVEHAALRNAEDARAAYRLGTGDFAAVYAAESSALAAREAMVGLHADAADATVRLWTQWARAQGAVAEGRSAVPECGHG